MGEVSWSNFNVPYKMHENKKKEKGIWNIFLENEMLNAEKIEKRGRRKGKREKKRSMTREK